VDTDIPAVFTGLFAATPAPLDPDDPSKVVLFGLQGGADVLPELWTNARAQSGARCAADDLPLCRSPPPAMPADETERRIFELHRRHWQRRSARCSCSIIGDRDYLSRLTTNPDRAALTSSLLISSVFTEPSRSRPALPWGLSGQAE
jgi:hypothetical protein